MKTLLSRLSIDPYIAAILGMVALASALPVYGRGTAIAGGATIAVIALMFFLQGARLAPQAALAGARHWRLHAVVLASTFLLFPAIGLTARALAPNLLTPALWGGVLMLCVLPSTVQSSIAFTSIARGNVPAALCAATASNLFGIALTPLLAGLLLRTQNVFSARGVADIVLQLLLPFAAGQLARPWIGDWVARNKRVTSLVDRGSILLVVYVAFSEGVTTASGTSSMPANCCRCCCWTPPCSPQCCWRPPGSAGCSASPAPMKSPSCFAAPRKALPAACQWPACCSPASHLAWSCCR